MTNGLHPPSFLQGFFSLIALYLVSYTLGYILIGLFKVDSKAKIHREFSRLLIGFLFILFCYSIIITAGSTIMLGLLIPIIIVVVNKLYRTTEKSSFLPEKKIVFVHLFYLWLFFLVACLFNYNPISGNIIQAEGDDLIFGRYCEHLDLTGEENIYLDWFYPSDQGNSFYHYADLWGGAIVGRFSGLGYYFGLYFVSSTFFIIIASWAAFSFLESLGYTLNFVNTLVCSTLIVLTSITKFVQIVLFAPVYKLGITPLIYFLNKLDIKVLALGLHSKIEIVLIL